MLTKTEVIDAWSKYNKENDFVELKETEFSPFWASMFHLLETEVLYSMVRHLKPKNIIEFSPASGWTSVVMLKACLKNAEEDRNYTADIKSFDLVSDSREANYIDESVSRKLIIGDALKTVPPHMDKCDFLFIDSDHGGDFTKKYCNTIVSKYKKGLIWVHDWEGYRWGDPGATLPEQLRGGFTPTDVEAKEFKAYMKTEDGKSISPIINLLDYLFTDMDNETRDNLLTRAKRTETSFERSPSQLLYKEG